MAKQKKDPNSLSRRERQIMDVLYSRTRASVGEVLDALPDPPSYSAVRTLLRVLEAKGHVKHFEEGVRYVYSPTVAKQSAANSALVQLVNTFFLGSVESTVAMLVNSKDLQLREEELDRIEQLIRKAKEEMQ